MSRRGRRELLRKVEGGMTSNSRLAGTGLVNREAGDFEVVGALGGVAAENVPAAGGLRLGFEDADFFLEGPVGLLDVGERGVVKDHVGGGEDDGFADGGAAAVTGIGVERGRCSRRESG